MPTGAVSAPIVMTISATVLADGTVNFTMHTHDPADFWATKKALHRLRRHLTDTLRDGVERCPFSPRNRDA